MIDPSKIDERIDEAVRQLSDKHGELVDQLRSVSFGFGKSAWTMMAALEPYIDARAELALLKLIQSPDFYSALMRSAAEVETP